jgi:phosphoserine phosphatase
MKLVVFDFDGTLARTDGEDGDGRLGLHRNVLADFFLTGLDPAQRGFADCPYRR